MAGIGTAIDAAAPADPAAAKPPRAAGPPIALVTQGRWAVIEDTHAPSSDLDIAIISLWLALVFLSFGLQIPRRRLTAIVLAIGVLSVASVMFVIVDLAVPYSGFFGIASEAMREALADMNR